MSKEIKTMDEVKNEKGGVSVSTENIFPVIKQWLYSEKEIFLRELVSNACDAVTKHKRLVSLSEAAESTDPYRITVTLDKELKTLTVSDNGIGMSADEIKKYICQIALSGALDFIEKYEGKSGGGGIIGHFGLGFYSAFMVADTVEVISKSYRDEPAVRWICRESGDFEFMPCEKEGRGTDVVLHVNDDNSEYLEEYKVRSVLEKYCRFMPVEIYFEVAGKEEPKQDENGKDAEKQTEKPAPKPINDTQPLWLKNPSECTDEEYKEFYRKVFSDYRDPLFQIHINADYPLNFKGILYFPKLNYETDSLEGQVKLYYNQVFVADNIKEVIPDYMLMLKGVLDCPDLPLNVSRSYLQNNGYVTRLTAHIAKKVADKITSMKNSDREQYEKIWKDIKIFVEYACLRDGKFYDRVKDALMVETASGAKLTVDEYLEKYCKSKDTGDTDKPEEASADEAKDGDRDTAKKEQKTVYYTNDKVLQAQYISMFSAEGTDVIVIDKMIDSQFITMLEQKMDIRFACVDSEVAGAIRHDGEEKKSEDLVALFRKVSGKEELKVEFASLKDESVAAIITVSEQSRRFGEMMKMYGMDKDAGMPGQDETLVLNTNSKLIAGLEKSGNERIAKHIYLLAQMNNRRLSGEEMKEFMQSESEMLSELL